MIQSCRSSYSRRNSCKTRVSSSFFPLLGEGEKNIQLDQGNIRREQSITFFLLIPKTSHHQDPFSLMKEVTLLLKIGNYICRMTAVSQVRLIGWASQKSTVHSWALALVLVFGFCFFPSYENTLNFFPALSWSVFLNIIIVLRKWEWNFSEDGAPGRQVLWKPLYAILFILPVQQNCCNLLHICDRLEYPIIQPDMLQAFHSKQNTNFPSANTAWTFCKYSREDEPGFPVWITNAHHKRRSLLRESSPPRRMQIRGTNQSTNKAPWDPG